MAGDRIHEPKPAATRSLFVKIVGGSPPFDKFAEAVWASCMFLLRVQSACLPLVMQLTR